MRGPGDQLLTVKEIATTLRLHPQTIRNWIDAGKLPHVRVGERRVRVWRSDLDALINASSLSGPEATPVEPAASIWDGVIPPPVAPD